MYSCSAGQRALLLGASLQPRCAAPAEPCSMLAAQLCALCAAMKPRPRAGAGVQGMRVRADGPQLISELIRKELGLDCRCGFGPLPTTSTQLLCFLAALAFASSLAWVACAAAPQLSCGVARDREACAAGEPCYNPSCRCSCPAAAC